MDPSGSPHFFYHCLKLYCSNLFLQDFLGIMFSINMLKVLRLPSLRICTILLSALFFYDIFFVFITPLFMSGKSVMVEVATGHSSDEQLPMVKDSLENWKYLISSDLGASRAPPFHQSKQNLLCTNLQFVGLYPMKKKMFLAPKLYFRALVISSSLDFSCHMHIAMTCLQVCLLFYWKGLTPLFAWQESNTNYTG